MSQADWDRSTIGGAGPDASRRRMLGTAAAALAAGFAAGFAGRAALARTPTRTPARPDPARRNGTGGENPARA